MKNISSNAYVVKLLEDQQISPIFNVSALFEFHGFNDNIGLSADKGWTTQIPKKPSQFPGIILSILFVQQQKNLKNTFNSHTLLQSLFAKA